MIIADNVDRVDNRRLISLIRFNDITILTSRLISDLAGLVAGFGVIQAMIAVIFIDEAAGCTAGDV